MPVVGLFLNGLMWQFIFSKGINQLKHVDKKTNKHVDSFREASRPAPRP